MGVPAGIEDYNFILIPLSIGYFIVGYFNILQMLNIEESLLI